MQSPEKLMPIFINDIIGSISGMTGLFISCIFSASLSTVSANLNSMAGVIYNDYIRNIRGYIHSESHAQYIMKTIILIIGIYSVLGGFMLEKAGSILQVIFTVLATSSGAIVGIFTLAMLYPRANNEVILIKCICKKLACPRFKTKKGFFKPFFYCLKYVKCAKIILYFEIFDYSGKAPEFFGL